MIVSVSNFEWGYLQRKGLEPVQTAIKQALLLIPHSPPRLCHCRGCMPPGVYVCDPLYLPGGYALGRALVPTSSAWPLRHSCYQMESKLCLLVYLMEGSSLSCSQFFAKYPGMGVSPRPHWLPEKPLRIKWVNNNGSIATITCNGSLWQSFCFTSPSQILPGQGWGLSTIDRTSGIISAGGGSGQLLASFAHLTHSTGPLPMVWLSDLANGSSNSLSKVAFFRVKSFGKL